MIGGYVKGEREVVAHFEHRGQAIETEIEKAIKRLTVTLQTKVKTEKLSGQVLGVRTGRGRRSIHEDTFRDGGKVVGVVSTNVSYMIGWETGWEGSGGGAQMAKAKAKFSPKGSADLFGNGGARKRSFLVPSLAEMDSSGAIRAELEAATERAIS